VSPTHHSPASGTAMLLPVHTLLLLLDLCTFSITIKSTVHTTAALLAARDERNNKVSVIQYTMSSTTAQRRKGPKSLEGIGAMKVAVLHNEASSPKVATVRRNKFGTGPFDKNWLNVDCCGLLCAGLTYSLHAYGVYAVCCVLLPPWMSNTDESGVRSMSIMGHFHRLAFSFVAVMAVYAHFKAMTTDPGAVPPE
jgi:hypothetical protein